MNVACPYCQKVIALKGIKPGRFQPKCPGCARPFALTVPVDSTGSPSATALESTGATPATPKPAARAAPERAAAATEPMQTAAHIPAPTVETTGEWQSPDASIGDDRTEPSPQATGAWLPDADPNQTAALDGSTPPANPDQTALFDGGLGETTAPGAAPAAAGTRAGRADFTSAGANSGKGEAGDVPRQLGGYEIVKQLGQGGMGTVYLARQISLDRPVALKVMNPRWASDPVFLARFTREAYAAAQLVHHNIVQIYDIGVDRSTNFFSMEFVKGTNLYDLVKDKKRLDVDEAVGYILQACRGLKFAHDQGMVHRDIKPDNLMLNDQGVVKVADLGLVKTPGAAAAEDAQFQAAAQQATASKGDKLASVSNVTNVGVAMGTPAYMAPEQGRNAADVDHRADIYSLGCTLYVMLTGRPVFEGKTAVEVITKHFKEPIVPPENFSRRVPKEISHVVLKMLQKRPEDRYADLGEVIADLEKFLGVQSAGPFTPQEEHANVLESAVKAFNEAPTARIRQFVLPGFLGACGLIALILAAFTKLWAAGILGLAGMTVLAGFLITGIANRTHLFVKARELVLGSSWSDYATWAVGGFLFLMLLWLFGILWVLILFAFVATGFAFAYFFLVDRKLMEERAPALEKAQKLLRNLRLKGLQEEALMQFVAQYSGDHWEEMFESLFGYEALLQARVRYTRGEAGKKAPRHAAWRDPIVAWIEARQRQRKEEAEKKMLLEVERKNLEAKGMSADEAKAKAAEAADAMVNAAAEMRKEEAPATAGEAPRPRRQLKSLIAAAEETYAVQSEPRKRPLITIGGLVETFIGWRVRFLAGAVLLGISLVWAIQNDLHTPFKNPDQDLFGELSRRLAVQKQLWVPVLEYNTPPLMSGFNVGAAGILLILSAGWRHMFVNCFFFPAAAIMLFGPMLGMPALSLPIVGDLSPQMMSLLVGGALAIVGGGYYLLFYGEE